ncbi:carbon starvation CstA family protein [Acetobacterium woodii]|uniref:Carbon starvation protein A n=1 Tax=Acetobacterium woodii (strain ATCC 29683 / DSM 1030 / JCM 2381 / KCTC 1655 / WB1) TaxID=931626 RepID=H6LF73_ACEWD|nr:carbon starvation CstA family protein [Acetobacterium woodii]AFA48173.1 carbon starvation protein A [Acetobacterium woodii DSM 1030]
MTTFFIGLFILVFGGFFYGKFVDRVFAPDNRSTPAINKADGVDFVAMPKWKNQLIELLNIAGTGPVLGPIQGILFGPLAFITIPLGCVLAGAVHDYMNGMISIRNGGAQMPRMVGKYLGKNIKRFYTIVLWLLLFLVGVVFIYTPGDLIVRDILNKDAGAQSSTIWIVYAGIFGYYLIATFFPIDKIIGRIYPIFGAILIISAIGVFVGIMMDGGVNLQNLSMETLPQHPLGQKFIPVFFITVACGILSGFHGSQSTLISRTVSSEKEGRSTFYNMMILEGFIAMCWAAGAMVLFNRGVDLSTGATAMVGLISREFLGAIGSFFAILGVIVLPITSGDTAFRSLRLMVGETFNIDQTVIKKRILTTLGIFIPAITILVFAKTSPNGFNLLWQYFGFTNQFVAIFALAMAAVYLKVEKKVIWITLIPGMFYTFIVISYICHAPIGLGLEPRLGSLIGLDPNSYILSYIIGAVASVLYMLFVLKRGKHGLNELQPVTAN